MPDKATPCVKYPNYWYGITWVDILQATFNIFKKNTEPRTDNIFIKITQYSKSNARFWESRLLFKVKNHVAWCNTAWIRLSSLSCRHVPSSAKDSGQGRRYCGLPRLLGRLCQSLLKASRQTSSKGNDSRHSMCIQCLGWAKRNANSLVVK